MIVLEGGRLARKKRKLPELVSGSPIGTQKRGEPREGRGHAQ
jgi:hypothetical protein